MVKRFNLETSNIHYIRKIVYRDLLLDFKEFLNLNYNKCAVRKGNEIKNTEGSRKDLISNDHPVSSRRNREMHPTFNVYKSL